MYQASPNILLYLLLRKTLSLARSVKHLGHILCSDLFENLDIIEKTKDMVRKANYMLQMFSCCDKFTKTTSFRRYCLAFPGCSLWSLASPQLSSLVVAFNNILRKIWSLPGLSHLYCSTCCQTGEPIKFYLL